MKSKKWHFLKIGLLLTFLLFKPQFGFSEISLTVIGEEKEISQGFIEGLEKYLPQFDYVYYSYKDSKVKNVLEKLSLPYLPVIIYKEEKLDNSDKEFLKKKRLITQKGAYYVFSLSELRYVTDVHLLGRENIPKQLGVFVMSLCPAGERALEKIVKFIKNNNLPIKLKLYFIANVENGAITSMHGPDEVEEDIRQILIEKYWPEKLYDYLLLIGKMNYQDALKKVGIFYKKIVGLRKEGEELLRENIKLADKLEVDASPTFLWENKYLFAGLDNAIDILDKEKRIIYKRTHPLAEYLIVGLDDHVVLDNILSMLGEDFRLKGRFIPLKSPLIKKYIEEFSLDYLPLIFLKKSSDSKTNKIIRAKLFSWEEVYEGFIMPKNRAIDYSLLYYPDRGRKPFQIDIIASRSEINMFKESFLVKELINAGFKVNYHRHDLFNKSDLYKEVKLKKLPVILWENQYIASSFKQLMTTSRFKYKFKNIKIDKKVLIDYFYSPNCGACDFINNNVLPKILEKYGDLIDLVKFNTLNVDNYEFKLKMEESFKAKKESIPKMFIAGKVLIGRKAISNNLEAEILSAFVTGKDIFSAKGPVRIEYFYNSSSQDITYKTLPIIINRYKNKVEVVKFDVAIKENLDILSKKAKDPTTPLIFISQNVLKGKEKIENNIDRLIQEELLYLTNEALEGNVFLMKLYSFTLPTIIAAGLLDGINPCAFAVIIFFISFLAVGGYRKREVSWICSFFILAVFIAYFLIGLGLFSIFYKLSLYKILSDILYYVIIFIVFLLAFLNLYDFIIYKIKKTPKSIILQLPYKIKLLMHKVIGLGYRKDSGKRKSIFNLVLIAFIVGFVVSVLESVCTGQVYFPTVAFISGLPGIVRLKVLSYLFIYNFSFIVPLIIIFLLSLAGITSQEFNRFLKIHIGKIKIFTACLFFLLGYILIFLY